MKAAPHEYYEQLRPEHLATVADWLLSVQFETQRDLTTEFDDNYTRGATTFGRQRQMIIKRWQSGQHEWLTVLHAGMDLTFAIGGIPIRFFADDHLNPQKRGFFRRNPTDSLFDEDEEKPVLWRFILEKPTNDEEEDRVFFIGYNAVDVAVCEWEYKSATRMMYAVGGAVPEPRDIKPVEVKLKPQATPEGDQKDRRDDAASKGSVA
jgi:hypothetical protein